MVINNVRIESLNGWYVGSVDYVNGAFIPCGRNSEYYPSEYLLEYAYGDTISLSESFHEAIRLQWLNGQNKEVKQ